MSHLTTRCAHGVMSTSDEQVKREMWTQRVQVSAVSRTCLRCILAVSRVGLSCKLETSSLRSLSIAPFLANVRLLISEMILSLPVLTKSERTCLWKVYSTTACAVVPKGHVKILMFSRRHRDIGRRSRDDVSTPGAPRPGSDCGARTRSFVDFLDLRGDVYKF